MLATPAYMVADLTKDLDNLEAERRILAGMNDPLAISFIDGAEQNIRHEIARVAALDSLQLQDHIEKATRHHLPYSNLPMQVTTISIVVRKKKKKTTTTTTTQMMQTKVS
jgi:hypothetical protein